MTRSEAYKQRFTELENIEEQFQDFRRVTAQAQNAAVAGARLLLLLLSYDQTAPPCRIARHGDQVQIEWENQHVLNRIYVDSYTSGVQIETYTPTDGTPIKTVKRLMSWSENGIVYSEELSV